MSELSERSGLPVASIKYYQREGLVPLGEHTSANQSQYDDDHVERLRVVRALIEVGGLSVASAKVVLAAIDDAEMPLGQAFGVAQRAASKALPVIDAAPSEQASQRVADLVTSRGWILHGRNPGPIIAARVLESYESLGHTELLETVDAYADAALIVAAADLAAVGASAQRAAMTETVVIGTVLGDALFAGLRRMAQEHLSNTFYPAPPEAIDINCEDETL